MLSYDGTGFRGWARQPGLRTVQGEIESVLARMIGEPPRLSVAGRTDAGVHAAGQVASFPGPDGLEPQAVQRALNGALSPEVVVKDATIAPRGFDARRSATAREYLYRVDTGPLPDPFTGRYVWHRPCHPHGARMRAAARHLEGAHDFASFCRPRPDASTERTLGRLTVSLSGTRVEIRAVADSFLHQMVRSLVGTLLAVSDGAIDPEDMPGILAARSRAAAGPVAPPHGLTLVRVRYGTRR